MVTPGPITTNGSMVTSLPNCGVGGEKNCFGRDQRDAGVHRRFAQPRLHHGFGLGKLRLGVDAAHFVFFCFDHDGLQSQVSCNGHGIDQIIFALGVGVTDPVENFQRALAVERHHAGIAQRDLALLGAGVGLLADRDQLLALHQEPAVAGRIGGAEAEHGERGAVLQRRAHALKGLGRNQRRVAKGNQEIVGAARDRLARRQHRMRRAEPLALDVGLGVGADAARLGGHGRVVGPDHDGKPRKGPIGRGMQHMGEQRLAGHGMQHFGQRGAHARALTGRKHHSQARSSVIQFLKARGVSSAPRRHKAFSVHRKRPGFKLGRQILIMFPCDSLRFRGFRGSRGKEIRPIGRRL